MNNGQVSPDILSRSEPTSTISMKFFMPFPAKKSAIMLGCLLVLTGTVAGCLGQGVDTNGVHYALCGSYRIEKFSRQNPAIDNGLFITLEEDGSLRATDLGSMRTEWTAEIGGTAVSGVIARNGTIYLVANPFADTADKQASSSLRSFSLKTGLPVGNIGLTFSDGFYIGSAKGVLITANRSGVLTAIDPSLNSVIWTRDVHVQMTIPPVISDIGVLVAAKGGRIVVIDPVTGEIISDSHFDRSIATAASLAGGGLLFADERGNLERSDSGRTLPLWRFKAGAGIYGVEIDGRDVYAASLDNFIYRLSADSGSVVWRRRMPNRLIAAPLVLGKRIYAAGVGDNEVFVLDSSNGRFLNRISMGNGVVATGSRIISDGNSFAVPVSGGYALFSRNACRSD
ncbi:MAG TPA: PQQ-binding-like beta-propeller repeat protein [Pyrinomonadaceae bacterium]|nr:PQQ-binding-like beta-propeller repeat protein [Pyrinomonadaceae bacterium]HMP64913.1 PQQ-binding-like beta-propeller repeat protein [Pyrinomonadaceae bacterium]